MLESADFLNNQAIELTSLGNFSEAIACYKRAITLEKENYMLWYNLGITYQRQGDLLGARKAFETAFCMNSYDLEVVEQLSITCLNQKDFYWAAEYCRMGLDQNPACANLWNTMGVIFFNQEEYEEAASSFEQAVSINPYYYDALFNLRDTYSELGNTAGSSECQTRLNAIEGGSGEK